MKKTVLRVLALCLSAQVALADAGLIVPRAALIDLAAAAAPVTAPVAGERRPTASLFADPSAGGLFAPLPVVAQPLAGARAAYRGRAVDQLRALIGHAESRRDGYDAVQYGAVRKPPKRPTDMTIAEIFTWIDATPGQPHAIGRYQFIPPTLRQLVRKSGTPVTARFTPQLQDMLSDILLEDAGFSAFTAGQLDRVSFMNNLAKIWAGLPNASGKSHYHGYAGNRAAISWARFDAEMRAIFKTR